MYATDIDNDVLTFSITIGPTRGSISLTGAAFTYIPTDIFSGQDSFEFIVSDGPATDRATITIDVSCNHCELPLNGDWERIQGNFSNNQEISRQAYEENRVADHRYFEDVSVKEIVTRWIKFDTFPSPVNANLDYTQTYVVESAGTRGWDVSVGATREPISMMIGYGHSWTTGASNGVEVKATAAAIPCHEFKVDFFQLTVYTQERTVRRPKPGYSLDTAMFLFTPKDADGNPILAQSESRVGLVKAGDAVTYNVYKRRAE